MPTPHPLPDHPGEPVAGGSGPGDPLTSPEPAASSAVERALGAVAAYCADAGLSHEPGSRAGEVVVTLPGERKLRTVASLLVREASTSVSAFVVRNPDENHPQVYRFLLRRNLRPRMLAYAIDDSGDVYARGRIPTSALDADTLDQLMGALLEAADEPFNELLVLGFLTSMRREWAWRVARGESLANLEPFRAILAGSEDDPRYAVGPLAEDGRDAADGPPPSGG